MMHTRYLIFDVESVADPRLVKDLQFPDEDITPEAAVRKYRDELMETKGTDFIPYTFQIPVSIALAKVSGDFRLLSLDVMGRPRFQPHEITRHFWQGWAKKYGKPTFVTFNGRGFDIPLMELAAFRYGLSLPEWFAIQARSFEQPRNRYNINAHLDLYDMLTNFGATRSFNGGLNLAANILGKPGKMNTKGCMVQDMYDAGEYERINDYCRCDVLDTYFVFLRTMLLLGNLKLQEEQDIVAETKAWLEERSNDEAYRLYLDNWGDWSDPWAEGGEHCGEELSGDDKEVAEMGFPESFREEA